jgi:hypothetical protein
MPGTYDTVMWGEIEGTLDNQTDLRLKFETKPDLDHSHLVSDITDLVYPVTKVNGLTGEVQLTPSIINAAEVNHTHTQYYTKTESDENYAIKAHTHEASDISDLTFPVSSVNSKTGTVVLDYNDVQAAPLAHDHDTLYYTQAYTDTNFSKVSHDHQDLYYDQAYINNNFLGINDTARDSVYLAGNNYKYYLNYAPYNSSNQYDPDSVTDPFVLTKHSNCPTNNYYWIQTLRLYTSSNSRWQIAMDYAPSDNPSMWIRNKYQDYAWNSWARIDNNKNPLHTISTGAPSGGKAGDVWFTV